MGIQVIIPTEDYKTLQQIFMVPWLTFAWSHMWGHMCFHMNDWVAFKDIWGKHLEVFGLCSLVFAEPWFDHSRCE